MGNNSVQTNSLLLIFKFLIYLVDITQHYQVR